MIKRKIEAQLKKASQQFGVVSVTGPRQSGKTTLVKKMFPHHEYINLENPAHLQAISDDPLSIISERKTGLIIDEVQKYPELLSYIQTEIDQSFKPGKFIITGSQNLLLSNKVNQSLAGRVAVLTLLPLNLAELNFSNKSHEIDFRKLILDGFYPGLQSKKLDRKLFYSSYINTYVERDVRSLSNVGDLTNFQRFLQILGGRVGQLLDLSSIGNDLGVSYKTVDAWISILEASYIAFRLQPYYKNYGKRVIKSPKIYFYDVGLASYLLGIDSAMELKNHFAIGALFENLVIADLLKTKFNCVSSSKLYFWRDSKGHEIDLLVDRGSDKLLLEIKSGQTYHGDFLKNIDFFKKITDEKVKSYLLYNGEMKQKIKDTQLTSLGSLGVVSRLV